MKTILIVEDDYDIRNLMMLYLKREYNVVSFNCGEEALVQIAENRPDIILLDITLPGMDGYEICEKLREDNIGIPIIFISAKREQSDINLGRELGAIDYITKPFDPGLLMATVRTYV